MVNEAVCVMLLIIATLIAAVDWPVVIRCFLKLLHYIFFFK